MKKAFTILELIVVLSIIAVAVGLGMAGMLQFRQTAQLNGAASELISKFQVYSNMARNSVPSLVKSGSLPVNKIADGFAVFFDQGDYSLLNCMKLPLTGEFTCDAVNPEILNAKARDYFEVAVAPIGPDLPRCKGLLFERRTGLIYSMASYTAIPSRSGICTIQAKHSANTLNARTVIVSLVDSSFNLQQ